jgi:hypothetical protein
MKPYWCAEVGRELLRVDMSLLSKRGEPEEDPRLLLKSLPPKTASAAPPLRDVSRVRRRYIPNRWFILGPVRKSKVVLVQFSILKTYDCFQLDLSVGRVFNRE